MFKLFLSAICLITLIIGAWVLAPRETQAGPEWQSFAPSTWILGPIQGADGKERTILDNLDTMRVWDIPITAFHFDAPDWMSCTGNAQFRYSDKVLERMRQRNIRGLFWIVPLIGLNCPEYQVAAQNGYFVKGEDGQPIVTDNFTGHGSWVDFDNPNAVAFWHTLLDQSRARIGDVMAGYYTDSVRPDLLPQGPNPPPNPEGMAYGEAFALDILNYTRTHIPDGDVVFKRYGKNTPSDGWLSQYAHTAYVNDLPTHFNGLKIGIQRVFETAAFMPLPYNEFSGFNNTAPDADTYIRRMHWGAFQPLMENVPKTAQPWDARYPPKVMETYRYYATLHWELHPYLHSYNRAAYEDHSPIFRDTNASEYSARLGNEFFVKYITDYATAVRLTLPPGQWIDYWNESKMYTGGKRILYNAPLGREPIFIARGAIIPMQVRGSLTGHGTKQARNSLTVNVYPFNHSTFRYHDQANGWLTLDVMKDSSRLALCTLEQVPSKPVIWRIALIKTKPTSVTFQNGAVGVNTPWGTALTERPNEAKVGKSASGWFYDAAAKRLIVKTSTRGTECPGP